jgi:hypothetical protein
VTLVPNLRNTTAMNLGLPSNMKDAICFSWLLMWGLDASQLESSPLRLNLDPHNVVVDQAAIINGVRLLEVVSNRTEDHVLDLGCRLPVKRRPTLDQSA